MVIKVAQLEIVSGILLLFLKGVSNFPQSSNDFSRLPFPLMEINAFPRSVMLEKIIHNIHVNRPEL